MPLHEHKAMYRMRIRMGPDFSNFPPLNPPSPTLAKSAPAGLSKLHSGGRYEWGALGDSCSRKEVGKSFDNPPVALSSPSITFSYN